MDSPYYDPYRGRRLKWDDLLQNLGHGRDGAYSYIAASLASHPLMDADALRPFPDELLNFELHLIDYVTKPFPAYKPESPKPFSTDVDCVGIDGASAYLFLHSDLSVLSLAGRTREQLRLPGAASVALLGDRTLSCAGGRLLRSDSDEPIGIAGPTKIVADPLAPDQAFVRAQDGDGISQLHCVRIRDGAVESALVRSGVDDFDVSRAFLLVVLKGKATVFQREDSAVRPLFEKNLASRARVFVDDEFFYEFLPKSQTLYVFADGKPVQQVKMVANVFKSRELVIEYIDGTIGTVGRQPVLLETPPIGAVANGEILVTWETVTGPPVITDLGSVDLPLIRRCGNLADKKKRELDARQEALFAQADQLTGLFEKRLAAIADHAEDLIQRIPDSLFFICLEKYNRGRVDEAFSLAADDISAFEMLAADERLSDAVADGKLSNDTLVKSVGPLTDLLQTDVSLYAVLVYDVLLAIENNPAVENLDRLQTALNELQAGTETTSPSLTQKLRVIQRIVLSLRAPF
jgi:hypothetical protein